MPEERAGRFEMMRTAACGSGRCGSPYALWGRRLIARSLERPKRLPKLTTCLPDDYRRGQDFVLWVKCSSFQKIRYLLLSA